MERLPPGHPSSPYNDDLTRKPPVARLKDLELPLQSNEHGGNGAATNREHDLANDVHVTARADATSSNGTSGKNIAAGGLGAASRPDAADQLGTASLPATADQLGTASRPDAADQLGTASLPATASRLGMANLADTGEWASTTDGEDAANGFGGFGETYEPDGEPYEPDGELDDTAGEPDGDGAEGTAERQDGTWLSTPTWSGTNLGTVGSSSWDSTPGWDSAPSWNSAPSWESAPDHHDNGAGQAWSEPEHGVDTLSQPAIDTELSRDANEPLTGPDGSWEWNGRYLTPEECQIADQALGRCRIAEGRNVFGGYGRSGLTPAMRRIEAQLEHGQLLPDTESLSLKSPAKFKQKLADLILRHPDKSAEELSLDVPDGIRYAFIVETENYAEATLQVHSRLKGNGFDLEVRRNCWPNPEYKGINSRWRDPAHDLIFEVQFHTAASWDVRQRAHALYEAITDPATPPEERERLRTIYAEMSAAVPMPPRCAAIPDYRKEGG